MSTAASACGTSSRGHAHGNASHHVALRRSGVCAARGSAWIARSCMRQPPAQRPTQPQLRPRPTSRLCPISPAPYLVNGFIGLNPGSILLEELTSASSGSTECPPVVREQVMCWSSPSTSIKVVSKLTDAGSPGTSAHPHRHPVHCSRCRSAHGPADPAAADPPDPRTLAPPDPVAGCMMAVHESRSA